MSNRHVQSIANRLSLRPPQRESLEILHDIVEVLHPRKGQDVEQALASFKAAFPRLVEHGFEEFERNFPSFCFGLATGVGKTRLMGAFISYLVSARNIRHFCVLAPNLTIYDKLIEDFSDRQSPKYVFQGIPDFAQEPPIVITGETYESHAATKGDMFGEMGVTINIFNISKINSEVRGGKAPRIKRLSEYIGDSYFNYLAGLPDLVLLMDESHRYRATQGVRAINELQPILGLELTATPKVKAGGGFSGFRNVVYSYPLHRAIEDGFVKEPAVATRESFDERHYRGEDGKARLEWLKLEDGIHVHEAVKVHLEVHARQTGSKRVKPLVLVVAQDTAHADELLKLIANDRFFEGRYREKVITVHSNQRGEEKDENVQKLLSVEGPDEPTEIVIHVNKLQEGWDVTNLYTIVPLRASASDILTEQTIGRGLRLPYGRRTGVGALDRLTIIAHEHFQRIIDEANKPDSIIRTGVTIGRDIPLEKTRVVESKPRYYEAFERQEELVLSEEDRARYGTERLSPVALQTAFEVIQKESRLPSMKNLRDPETRDRLYSEATELYSTRTADDLVETAHGDGGIKPAFDYMLEQFEQGTISVPKIVIQPKDYGDAFFTHFELDTSGINYPPVDQEILIRHLQSHKSERIQRGAGVVEEDRLENYIVRYLIERNDVSYDDHSDLLQHLAGKVLERLRGYLRSEAEVENVVQYYASQLAALIYSQMVEHRMPPAVEFEVDVTRGFTELQPAIFSCMAENGTRDFRATLDSDKRDIRSLVFEGFSKCLYPRQKFDSDSERRFAVLLEDDPEVLRWFKPAKGQLSIFYHKDRRYEPDFVIEMKDVKVIAEPKRADQLETEEVMQKADAAREWCRHATKHSLEHGDKPWHYLLIAHHEILHGRTVRSFFS